MNKLAIVFSDLHIHNYKQFNEGGRRLKNGIALLDYVFKLADKNKIKYLLMPGDLHNLMEIVSTKAINAVIKCLSNNFKQYPDITLFAISGNHDYAEKNLIDSPAESVLEHLAEIFPDNFLLMDFKKTGIQIGNVYISGISYYEYPEDFRKALEYKNNFLKTQVPGNKYILLMHQLVASGLPIEDHIQPDDPLFDMYEMVFNGHMHNGGEITDRFINVGAPMHRNASDIGQKKGIWIVNLEDPQGTISFKDLTSMFPQFIQKEQGSQLTEWESEQYVIWYPADVAKTIKEKELSENFCTNLSPKTIMQHYCDTIKISDEILNYGLSLLK